MGEKVIKWSLLKRRFQKMNINSEKEVKFLSDPFACNSIENVIIQNCKKTNTIDFKFENSMKIIEYQC